MSLTGDLCQEARSQMLLQKLLFVLFSFLFSSKDFKISLVLSFLAYRLFRNLFNFQILGDFPGFILLLVSNLSPLWSENIVFMIWIILNLLNTCFISYIWFSFGECSMCTWKVCLFSSPWSEFYRCQVSWQCCSSTYSLSLLIFYLVALFINESEVLISPTIIVEFLPAVLFIFLLCIL